MDPQGQTWVEFESKYENVFIHENAFEFFVSQTKCFWKGENDTSLDDDIK